MKKKIICVRIQENVNIKIKINNPFKYCTEKKLLSSWLVIFNELWDKTG